MNQTRELGVYCDRQPDGSENFGEYLCFRILKNLGCEPVRLPTPYQSPAAAAAEWDADRARFERCFVEADYLFTALGGLLNTRIWNALTSRREAPPRAWHVWGSGVDHIKPEPRYRLPPAVSALLKPHLVRGPLTRDYYALPAETLLGDPAYLAPRLWRFPERDPQSVFIQFFDDAVPLWPTDCENWYSARLTGDPREIERQFLAILEVIQNASVVLTSSMHAAVVAHAYGVPWAPARRERIDCAFSWKWHDTFAALGLEPSDFRSCDSAAEAAAWHRSIRHKLHPITPAKQDAILLAFPFSLTPGT